MIELRWKVEEWTEYHENGLVMPHTEKPVLQYRQIQNPSEFGIQPPIWTKWEDVPTEYIEEMK